MATYFYLLNVSEPERDRDLVDDDQPRHLIRRSPALSQDPNVAPSGGGDDGLCTRYQVLLTGHTVGQVVAHQKSASDVSRQGCSQT